MALNKYNIGDNVQANYDGKEVTGQIYEIKSLTKRHFGNKQRDGYSVLVPSIGYKILGFQFKIPEQNIIKKI